MPSVPPARPYDEEEELTRYVLDHYLSLHSKQERTALVTIQSRQKAVPPDVPSEHPVRRRWEGWDDSEVTTALQSGPEAFLRRTRERVLKEHADAVFIHRCSRCHRIVATPKAQQCLWCGHDWHTRS